MHDTIEMPEPRFGNNVTVGANTTIDCNGYIGDNVVIGNNVVLEGNVTVGKNTRIDHGTVIRGNVVMGTNNWLYPYCVVGTGPQHLKHTETSPQDSLGRFGAIHIGNDNIMREFTTVHLPVCEYNTTISSNCYLMAHSHVAHDCHVYNYVTVANNTALGGHSVVYSHANLGFGNNIHQFCKVGSYTMIGMGNNIAKDVLPFALINRNTFTKVNRIGMQRAGISHNDIEYIESMYATGTWRDMCAADSDTVEAKWYVEEIQRFVQNSERGVYEPMFAQINI